MKFNSDVDIDFADRSEILSLIRHTPAAMRKSAPIRRHNTGVYVTDIPYDPAHNIAALDYKEADKRGYIKLDFLNVWVYKHVKSELHLVELMKEPDWNKLSDGDFVNNLIHLSNHFQSIKAMPEPINSIPRLAMFLAVIRPAKKHLIGRTWSEISKTIWDKEEDGYHFKRSHSCAYAMLVVVHMNLLVEQERNKLDVINLHDL